MENQVESPSSIAVDDGMGSHLFLGERDAHQEKVTAEWRTRHNRTECHRRKQITLTIKQLYDLLPQGHTCKKDKTSILEEVVHYLRVVYENVANIHDLEKAFVAQQKSEKGPKLVIPVTDRPHLPQPVKQAEQLQSPTMGVERFADRLTVCEEIIPLSALVYPAEGASLRLHLSCASADQIVPNQAQYSPNSFDFLDNF